MNKVDGQDLWAMYSDKNYTEAVTNLEYISENNGLRLPPKCVTPLICGYHPYMYVAGDLK